MLPEEMPLASEEIVTAISPPGYPFWGWIDFLLMFGLLVVMLAIVLGSAAVAMAFVPGLAGNPVPLYLPTQIAFYFAIYFALMLVFRLRYERPVFSSLGWNRNFTPRLLGYCALGGALLSPLIAAIAQALHTPQVEMDVVKQLQSHPVILALFGVMAVTLAPIFEELLFRGFLQPLFSRTLGVFAGILLTGVLFGVLHSMQYKGVWQYVAAISVVGVVLGIVRYRTGSLIPSTVMHACFNLVASTEIFFHHPK